MSFCFKKLSIFIMILFVLQGCSYYVLKEVSYPTLSHTEKKEYKIYKLSNLDWVVKYKDIEFIVDIKNYKTLKSHTSLMFIPMEKEGIRAPNANKSPFVIDIGVRAKRSDYALNIDNAVLFMKETNELIEPSAIYVAHLGRELDCLLYKANDLNLPLASRKIIIPTTKEPAKPDSPKHWKCIKYVFDMPIPDSKNRFSLFIGQISGQNSENKERIMINFDPLKYESIRNH